MKSMLMSDSSSEFSDRCILYSLTGLESHWSNPLSSENHEKQGSLSESEFCAVIFYFNYTCRVKKIITRSPETKDDHFVHIHSSNFTTYIQTL